MAFDLKIYLQTQKELVEAALAELVPEESVCDGLYGEHIRAMRYSLFVGGKRVRPILCLAAARTVSDDAAVLKKMLPASCALECIHTYSLIHDDLPAMDNDDLRRGKPTNHKVFGEAEAILAGDGLLTYAFDLLSNQSYGDLEAGIRLRMLHVIARAAGSLGMVGGQALDMAGEGRELSFEQLRAIHRAKTGALITAAVEAGAIGGGASEEELLALREYGKNIGLAFQIVDDLLDVQGSTEELGKPAGSDLENSKATYPAFFGISETKNKAEQAAHTAIAALTQFDERATPLRELAHYIVNRTK